MLGRAVLASVLAAGTLALAGPVNAQGRGEAVQIKTRHADTTATRERAAQHPRSEGDQALVEGWPLYRTERGQAAFNDAMATLKATDGLAPAAQFFGGCTRLDCDLKLPEVNADGWLPAGRLWVSPQEYVLIVHSPRGRAGSYRRRTVMSMKYFVFHEFHNSSRNTDLYDTISSHKSSVFVPFYLSKTGIDARGRSFVTIVQVAPHDVVSIHASNHGSAGPGVEIAKNAGDAMEPLQGLAGIVLASMTKAAVPRLTVVNHRGLEGLPFLQAYNNRLTTLRQQAGRKAVTLPFVPAEPQRVAAAAARLEELIRRPGLSPSIPVAERTVLPPRLAAAPQPIRVAAPATAVAQPVPRLIEPPREIERPVAVTTEPVLISPIRPAQRPNRS